MKKLIAAIFIILAACTPRSAMPSAAPGVTPTRLIIPAQISTREPTKTPNIVTPTPSPTPTPEDLFYVIQSGDTLTSIANQFGLTVKYLAEVNSIADPNVIWPGQVLQLSGVVAVPTPTITDGKQIIVKLSVQRVTPYKDGVPAHLPFTVSTGTSGFPTRIGEYHIWVKLLFDDMDGPGYHLTDVPFVMYFDEFRGFHGKTWNNIYGRPSSHGCVNMTVSDAEWLFNWADVGTDVLVIP